ncbi:MAG: stage V sporulation protein AD [Lachnospiraceae bacterium]|nr:stage V sporulation protein AD [Lachnospiraceae bacterium]
MNTNQGKQTMVFDKKVYIVSAASIVGKKEGEGPLKKQFDQVVEDPFFAMKTWEEAESKFVEESSLLAIEKAGLDKKQIRFAFAGDLLGQLIATSFGIKNLEIPFVGLYGACSNIALALAMGAMTICGGHADHVLCAASSHFGSAEKQFRFPLEYGNQRAQSSTWTVTGCGAFVLSGKKNYNSGDRNGGKEDNMILIKGATIGKIVDYDIKDAQNMGAAMAPAAAHVIYQALNDYNKKPEEFDRIITGDLGMIGKKLLEQLLKENKINISKNHMDCGMKIFDSNEQDTHSGGSGCACSAVVLASMILKKMKAGEWNNVLFVPTGAMFSPTSFNEGQAVPGVAHAVWLSTED